MSSFPVTSSLAFQTRYSLIGILLRKKPVSGRKIIDIFYIGSCLRLSRIETKFVSDPERLWLRLMQPVPVPGPVPGPVPAPDK